MSYLTASDAEAGEFTAFSPDETVAGHRYEAEIRVDSAESSDFGLIFGGQPAQDAYSGVLAFVESDFGEIQLLPVDAGEYGSRKTADLPDIEGQAVVVSVDFGEETVIFEIFGVEGRLSRVELENPGISAGYAGVYRYHGGGNWLVNRFRAV